MFPWLQPDDRGTISGVQVERVVRRGSTALHYTDRPLEEGGEVELEVDWERRFDHMQQHSGKRRDFPYITRFLISK